MTRRDEDLLRGDLQFARTGDEGIVYDDAGGQVHVLNGSGARLWELLSSGLTPAEAVQRLAEDYGAPVARVQGDVAELLATFRSLGLLASEGGSDLSP